jgi:hypothetical protein
MTMTSSSRVMPLAASRLATRSTSRSSISPAAALGERASSSCGAGAPTSSNASMLRCSPCAALTADAAAAAAPASTAACAGGDDKRGAPMEGLSGASARNMSRVPWTVLSVLSSGSLVPSLSGECILPDA